MYRKQKVCRLQWSLYGLKQLSRAWFDHFSKCIYKVGYSRSQADNTIFVKDSLARGVMVLIVYIDDIVLTRDNDVEISELKKVLATEFEVKDLGLLKYFLGMEVTRSQQGIVVSQRKYTIDLLKNVRILGCKPANFLLNSITGANLVKKERMLIMKDIKDWLGNSSICRILG